MEEKKPKPFLIIVEAGAVETFLSTFDRHVSAHNLVTVDLALVTG